MDQELKRRNGFHVDRRAHLAGGSKAILSTPSFSNGSLLGEAKACVYARCLSVRLLSSQVVLPHLRSLSRDEPHQPAAPFPVLAGKVPAMERDLSFRLRSSWYVSKGSADESLRVNPFVSPIPTKGFCSVRQIVEKLCDLQGTEVNAPADAQTSPVDLPCPIAICAKADTKPLWRPLENRSELNDGEKGTVLLD